MKEGKELPRMKAHCPRCNGERACDVHGAFDQPWEWHNEEHSENGKIDHRLLQCRGCEIVFYWRSSWDSQDYDHHYNRETGEEEIRSNIKVETYPVAEKGSSRPDWSWALYKTDTALGEIMSEVYTALEARAYILAAVGLRTALDRITEILGIDPAISLSEKVNALLKDGRIGKTESETLTVVAEAGNAAAHRGWSPDSDDFRPLLTTLEQFIQRAILSGNKALTVKSRIPPRPRRRTKPSESDPENEGSTTK